ncbi:MAG: asparagine synthase (glutamine-hydrolyzing) [Planctomycetota bacterium]
MCGILGGINTDFDDASLRRLHHRGPDQSRLVTLDVPEYGIVTLGQTRLNIVDRRDIDLPVRMGDSYILFNGEIYNYPELRSELAAFGWSFQTNTDSEVALAAYLQWGPDCLQRFNGMFALAVWDGKRFFCARDRMGKKPFFYRLGQSTFEFASEIKAFSHLEFTAHELFELFEFCFNEHTLYRGILALRPAHYLVYDLTKGTCYTRCYWDVEHPVGRRITDEKTAVNSLLELLEDAVRLRLRADVPVSLFLAGGLDSSIIAKLSSVEEAFTCQFDEFKDTINEEQYVRDLALRLGIRTHFVRPTRGQFLHDLGLMSYHLEMPTGSFSVFPLYRLAKACHARGFKVALTGEGSDELFAGYARNELLLGETRRCDDPKRRHYSAMLERYDGGDLDRFCRMASRSGLIGAGLMKMFLTDHWSARKSMLENICYIESRIFLQPLLQMADRMCMANSVEGRCPFLDYRLVEFAFSLDDSLRYRDGVGKWIVHRAAEKLLPKNSLVLHRPIKDGLPTPVNLWMHGTHSFDRKHWNALMTAECIKSLMARPAQPERPHSAPIEHVLLPEMPRLLDPELTLGSAIR